MVLPEEALQTLKVSEGDVLFLTPAAEGWLRITPDRPGFEEKMQVAGSIMNRYRNAFRELAHATHEQLGVGLGGPQVG